MTKRRRKKKIANGGIPPGAVAADKSRQTPCASFSGPPSFYVDVEFNCRDCGKSEVWTAKDQKWFYEVAKGSLHATAVRCRDCRRKRREAREQQREHMRAIEEARGAASD